MRFGIMAMQLEALVPSGVPAEQVMASIMNFDHAGLAKSLADKGFNPIELGGDLGMFLPNVYSPESVEKLAALQVKWTSRTPCTCRCGRWNHPPRWRPCAKARWRRSCKPSRLRLPSSRKSMCCTPPARWRRSSTT